MTGWDGLAYFNENYKIKLSLAEELRAEKANQYLIRVRDGVEFHNGKTLTIDDVIYSIRPTKNQKLKLFGNAGFGAIDLKRIRKLDRRTCRLFLSRADVTLMEAFAQYFQGVVPVGYQPNAVGKGPLRFIGTGPFKVQSFTPGRESVHVKNENYWRNGQPYFDQVRIINFPDDAAKVNALLSAQVDCHGTRTCRSPKCRSSGGGATCASTRPRRAPGHRSACGSTQLHTTTSECGARCGYSLTGRRW